MQIETIPSPWSSSLQKAYYQSSSAIQGLLEYPPFAETSYQRRLDHLEKMEDLDHRRKLADIVRSYHEPELLHPAVEKNLLRLKEQGSVVVIGGQQAGLLTGPLYTIHKIINMIQLAKQEEKRLNRPVIPVFWIAGEDHDRAEVDHIWIRSTTGDPEKFHFPTKDSEKRVPISSLKLDQEEIRRWLKQLAQKLPDTEYKKEWLTDIQHLTTDSPSWTRFFARILHYLFGEHGLLLIDSAYAPLRKLEEPFFRELLDKSEELNRSIRDAIHDLEKRGFSTTLHLEKQQGLLFLEEDEERKTLFRDGNQWMTRGGSSFWTTEQLKTKSSQLSNNVTTRPLMQEYLFPTLTFVTGVGELAYWSCLRPAFQMLGIQMPILFPRTTITLMEPHIQKRMDGFQLSIHSLSKLEQEKEAWLSNQYQTHLEPLFAQAELQLDQLYKPLLHELQQRVGMNVQDIGRKNMGKVKGQLQYLQQHSMNLLQNQKETELRRWDEVINALQPLQQSQERVYNLLEYWNRYGLSWIQDLLNTPLLATKDQHQVFRI